MRRFAIGIDRFDNHDFRSGALPTGRCENRSLPAFDIHLQELDAALRYEPIEDLLQRQLLDLDTVSVFRNGSMPANVAGLEAEPAGRRADGGIEVDVARSCSHELLEVREIWLHVDSPPPALVEVPRHAVIGGTGRPHIDVEAKVDIRKRPAKDNIFGVLRIRDHGLECWAMVRHVASVSRCFTLSGRHRAITCGMPSRRNMAASSMIRLKRPSGDPDAITAAYEALLGRRPESASVIDAHVAVGTAEAIRRIAASPEHAARRQSSPFYHYNSRVDGEEIIRRYAAHDLAPDPDHLTNFLGVRIRPGFLPSVLAGREGEVEPIPIPANWHADIAEWAAALRAVDLARTEFTMAELGCGWGCWMNNTGAAARVRGLDVRLIGVEADEGHVAFAHEACSTNGFPPQSVTVIRGVAAATEGTALFPNQKVAGEEWGLEPTFGADAEQVKRAVAAGTHDAVRMVPLREVIGDNERLDLLHIDIQGGEADLVAQTRQLLTERVAYLVIGTHSREIEGRLFGTFASDTWRLEIERPAILALNADKPSTLVDGVQGWRNLSLLPD
jgi:FkbM family methyltransferase